MEERLDDAIHILRDQAQVKALAYWVAALGDGIGQSGFGWRHGALLGHMLVGHGSMAHQEGRVWAYFTWSKWAIGE